MVDVAGAAVGGPQVAALINGDADEALEVALRGAGAVDRSDELAVGVEHLDHVVARIANEHLARRRDAGRIADRDARRTRELARARAGDSRLAGARADLALRLAVFDPPPERGNEVA